MLKYKKYTIQEHHTNESTTELKKLYKPVNLLLCYIICRGHHSFLQFPRSVIDSVYLWCTLLLHSALCCRSSQPSTLPFLELEGFQQMYVDPRGQPKSVKR